MTTYITNEFNNSFYHDLAIITNKTYYFNRIKTRGSYKKKKDLFREDSNKTYIITDIDLQASVNEFNNKLIDDILLLINNCNNSNNNFVFTKIQLGINFDITPPWFWNKDGICQYNKEKINEWIIKLKDKIPDFVHEYIYNLFKNEKMQIKSLLEIEEILVLFEEKNWSLECINNNRIFFLELMKKYSVCLEFFYLFKNKIISVDIGIVNKHDKYIESRNYVKYYQKDTYKILKSIIWKTSIQEQEKLLMIIYSVNRFVVFKYKLIILMVYYFFMLNPCKNINKKKILELNIKNLENNINYEISYFKHNYFEYNDILNCINLDKNNIIDYIKGINIITNIMNTILLNTLKKQYNIKNDVDYYNIMYCLCCILNFKDSVKNNIINNICNSKYSDSYV